MSYVDTQQTARNCENELVVFFFPKSKLRILPSAGIKAFENSGSQILS